jgi:hypothetical protein
MYFVGTWCKCNRKKKRERDRERKEGRKEGRGTHAKHTYTLNDMSVTEPQ